VGIAGATLEVIGTANYLGGTYNLIYENDQGLVWLDYTKGYATWQNQVNWASGLGGSLTVTLNPGYTTDITWTTGWRLPNTDESKADLYGPWGTDVGRGDGFGWGGPDQNDYYDYRQGYNMVNSEMGHLYYETLGNKGYYATNGTQPQSGWGLYNTGDFANLQADAYWSDTEYSRNLDYAWRFYFYHGFEGADSVKDGVLCALAVHPGEVNSAPVPEPATMLLLASGLAGLAGVRKRFKK